MLIRSHEGNLTPRQYQGVANVVLGDNERKDIAEAAAGWWASRLSPLHGLPFGGTGADPFAAAEVEKFRLALASEIRRTLGRYPKNAAIQWLDTLRVDGMNHTGILADVAEQIDMTGIIFHLPRARMDLHPNSDEIIVNKRIIWRSGKWCDD